MSLRTVSEPLTTMELRVLVAVVEGARTVREAQKACGLRSTAQTSAYLHRLRRAGLVAFEDGKAGTLRPLVSQVPLR